MHRTECGQRYTSTPFCTAHSPRHLNKLDNIDLTVLPFLQEALSSIANISQPLSTPHPNFSNATRIDTHVHPIPSWFRALQPLAAGRETPTWDIASHLEFMSSNSITRSILCISTPQANAFPGDRKKTVALARLLNEFSAELVRVFPERFSFLAVTALPYVEETLQEVKYALEELGAVGVGVLTNHEGLYPGDEAFKSFWEYLQERGSVGGKEIVFIHPTDPVIRLDNGTLINSKPCSYSQPSNSSTVRADFLTSSTSFRARRILLRDRARYIIDHSFPHHHRVPETTLAGFARCWCFSGYRGPVPARVSSRCRAGKESLCVAVSGSKRSCV